MNNEKSHHPLDSWEGDFEELHDHVEQLADDEDLCERVFCTKNEAFNAALYLREGARPD